MKNFRNIIDKEEIRNKFADDNSFARLQSQISGLNSLLKNSKYHVVVNADEFTLDLVQVINGLEIDTRIKQTVLVSEMEDVLSMVAKIVEGEL